MEYIKLPNCSTKKPDRILAALRTEKGRRLFAIVAREINKRGFSLNQDNRLHEYFVWSEDTEEQRERTKDWNQIVWIMEEKSLQIRWISYDTLRRVGELLE